MKRILLSFAFSVAFFGAAFAGQFENYPTVGGAAKSCGTVNGVQNCTVPAGPTAVTGDETIPGDTNLSSGRSPQTVVLSMRALNAAPLTLTTCAAAACGSHTVGNNSGGIVFTYSTTIDSATVVTPASPMVGQRFSIGSSHTITSLTVTANTGSSLAVTTPTVLTASTTVPQGYEFVYMADTKWYKVR